MGWDELTPDHPDYDMHRAIQWEVNRRDEELASKMDEETNMSTASGKVQVDVCEVEGRSPRYLVIFQVDASVGPNPRVTISEELRGKIATQVEQDGYLDRSMFNLPAGVTMAFHALGPHDVVLGIADE